MTKKAKQNEQDTNQSLKSEPVGPKVLLPNELLDIEAYFASDEVRKEKLARLDGEKQLAQLNLELMQLKTEKKLFELNRLVEREESFKKACQAKYESLLKEIRARLGLPDDAKFGYDPSTLEIRE